MNRSQHPSIYALYDPKSALYYAGRPDGKQRLTYEDWGANVYFNSDKALEDLKKIDSSRLGEFSSTPHERTRPDKPALRIVKRRVRIIPKPHGWTRNHQSKVVEPMSLVWGKDGDGGHLVFYALQEEKTGLWVDLRGTYWNDMYDPVFHSFPQNGGGFIHLCMAEGVRDKAVDWLNRGGEMKFFERPSFDSSKVDESRVGIKSPHIKIRKIRARLVPPNEIPKGAMYSEFWAKMAYWLDW